MILYAGVSGVNFGMLNMYPKHNSRLSFEHYFSIIDTLEMLLYCKYCFILFQVEKNCYTATCPIRLNPELCLSMFLPS